MKYIYQILSYIAVIIITLIIVNNIRFAKDIDHKNELKRLHQQNDSLQANIESNKVLINSLSFEIDSFKTKIEVNKKELATLKHKAKKNKDKYNEESNRINSLSNTAIISEFTNAFE
jgi:chromosome segregation ATPase